LRGIGSRMDMPAYCAEQNLTPALVQEVCHRHRARLVVAGSSVKLTAAPRRTGRVARFWRLGGCARHSVYPGIRGGAWGTPLTRADYDRPRNSSIGGGRRKRRAAGTWTCSSKRTMPSPHPSRASGSISNCAAAASDLGFTPHLARRGRVPHVHLETTRAVRAACSRQG